MNKEMNKQNIPKHSIFTQQYNRTQSIDSGCKDNNSSIFKNNSYKELFALVTPSLIQMDLLLRHLNSIGHREEQYFLILKVIANHY